MSLKHFPLETFIDQALRAIGQALRAREEGNQGYLLQPSSHARVLRKPTKACTVVRMLGYQFEEADVDGRVEQD